MANTKISALTPGAPAQGNDLIPIARGAANFSLKVSDVVATQFPQTLNRVNLTTQAAAISGQSLSAAAPATAMYRVAVYLAVTRGSSTTSILGGAAGVTVNYTDAANGGMSCVIDTADETGTSALGSSSNSPGTTLLVGNATLRSLGGAAISVDVDYTSVGVTTMQYAASFTLEQL